MDKIYCGINKVPKKYRLGTADECFGKGQIRYYGFHQVDANKLSKKKSKKEPKLIDIRLKFVKYKTMYQRLNREYQKEKNENKKNEIKKKMDKAKENAIKYSKLLKQMDPDDQD